MTASPPTTPGTTAFEQPLKESQGDADLPFDAAPDADPTSVLDAVSPPPDLDEPPAAPATRTVVVLDASAVEVARAAAVEDAGDEQLVGEYLGAVAEDEVAVTASFLALERGYRGWHWSVTVALVDAPAPTVSEVVLLPGPAALVAPAWVPWDQRVQAGDVGLGDLLLTSPDDFRLAPGYLDSDDPAVEAVAQELGLGRPRVLSRDGRLEAAERWHDGAFGPGDDIAKAAPGRCGTCGFYAQLAGSLGGAFGVCANEYAPADGRVVDVEYGCGAHSETVIDRPAWSAVVPAPVDELALEVHHRAQPDATDGFDASPSEASPSDAEPDAADLIDAEPEAEPERAAAEPSPEPNPEPDSVVAVDLVGDTLRDPA